MDQDVNAVEQIGESGPAYAQQTGCCTDLSCFDAVVNRRMEARDPSGAAAPEYLDCVPVLFQDRHNFVGIGRIAAVTQEVRRTDGLIGFMAPMRTASAGTLPNQRPRDVFEFFTRASTNCAK